MATADQVFANPALAEVGELQCAAVPVIIGA